MSKVNELIDKYNELTRLSNERKVNDFVKKEINTLAYDTLFALSNYQRDNLVESDLLNYTLFKGIDSIYYKENTRINKPLDICPLTYHKLDNNKVMVIADLHYINRQIKSYKYHEDSIMYVKAAMYFARLNNIKEIIVLGDLIDGYYHNWKIEGLQECLDKKTNTDFYDENIFITNLLRKELPDVKIRAILGNHDINALHECIKHLNYKNIDKGYIEFLLPFINNNIKIDGLGNVIYRIGDNNVLFEHFINKFFGIYNPLEVEYECERSHLPINSYRSISGHAHYFTERGLYDNQSVPSNVICPCLKADYEKTEGSHIIEYPGFLIVESIDDKIMVEPFFINKLSNGKYNINNLEGLCEFAKEEQGKELPNKYRTYSRDKKIVLEKVIK